MTPRDDNPGKLDPAHNQRKASDPLSSAWVAASAGTGKTKVLTDRVLRLLLAGAQPQRLLCLTFTKAAAAEMATRISTVLSDWAIAPDEALKARLGDLLGTPVEGGTANDAALMTRARRLFALSLEAPGGMRIQTIHSFCQTILKRFPLEAGVSPHFEILGDREADVLKTQVRENIAHLVGNQPNAHLVGNQPDTHEDLVNAWTFLVQRLDEDRFESLLGQLMSKRGRFENALDAHGGLAPLRTAISRHLGLDEGLTAQTFLETACTDAAIGPVEALRTAARGLLASKSKTDVDRGTTLAAFLGEADPALRAGLFDAYKNAFLTKESDPRKILCTKAVETAAPGTAETLEQEANRLVRVVNTLKSWALADASGALFTVAHTMLQDYRRRKEAMGRLDYEDLILATRALLSHTNASAWVLYKLDGGLDHLLVDEAQDTSPEQWDIARILADAFFADDQAFSPTHPRTVFAVGDRKQSIYGFQGADPRVFETMHAHFAHQVRDLGGRFADVPLHISFRSTEPVLALVNDVFASDPGRDGVGLAGEDITHVAHRSDDGGLVELWPPVVPEDKDMPAPWKPPVEALGAKSARARLARIMANRIKRMIGGDERLASQGRPIQPGDIMVLVRQRSGFETDLVGALKTAGVPVAGVDRLMLSDQISVMDLMALGRVMLLPEDDLSLAALLKSPLMGLDEDALFTLAHGRSRGVRLWTRLQDQAGSTNPFGRAFGVLDSLREISTRLTPYAFYAHVLDGPMNGRRNMLARLGPEAEDPIDEYLALTLAFERVSPPSLQGFLSWMEQGETEIKRDLDQGLPKAVRIMTVHGSKGLQAPIVFLPDTFSMPQNVPTVYWTRDELDRDLPLWCPTTQDRDETIDALTQAADQDRDREYRRLLYVAMTRAADRLYVCGWKSARPAIKADTESWYALMRTAFQALGTETTDPDLIQDGLPDAPLLRLEKAQGRVPPPSSQTLVPVAPQAPDWIFQPAPRIAQPTRPLTPSNLLADDELPVRSPVDPAFIGAGRYQRGRLIHRLLQVLPDLPSDRQKEAATRFLSRRTWGLEAENIPLLVQEVLAVLTDPACASLFAPGSRAEVPLMGRIGTHVINGQVDRLAVQGDQVLVVDYKTNRPPPKHVTGVEKAYIRQMAAYRLVLKTIFPDKAVRCFIVWTDGPHLMELPAPDMDQEMNRLFPSSQGL